MKAADLILIASIGASVLGIGLSSRALLSARYELDQAIRRDNAVVRDVARLRELREATQIAHLGPVDQSVVYERVRRCLAAVGVNGSRFDGVSRQTTGERTRGTTESRVEERLTQTVALRLLGLTPAELGSFLDRWRQIEPIWRITRIEMTGDERLAASRPGPFRVEIEMSASYLDTRALPPDEVARIGGQR